jgi:hypothetical protein
MLECWNAGMLECWNAGMLEFAPLVAKALKRACSFLNVAYGV